MTWRGGKMKKIPAFLLTVAFALLLTACGNAEQSPSPVVKNSRLESPTEQAGTSSPTDKADTDNTEADAKKETGEMTTIQIIINEQGFEAELYDLQGRPVKEPKAGFYIRTQGSKVSKVLVK